jgi:Na+/H+ antiporter NhaD/arsenite permease-like protein
MVLPFGLLLACMAVLPLHWPQWWERHYAKVSLSLATVTTAYYVFGLPAEALQTVGGVARDYAGFIVLIASLYIVSGGIHIQVKGVSSPGLNSLVLALGGLMSNILGTTGASILLIRPWLRMNRHRPAAHQIIFFIFIVSNVGGCLTPIGDPPLLVGFIKGVPFWWVLQFCWPMWLVSMVFLLAAFYFIDRRHAGAAAPAETEKQLRFEGLWNLVFLGIVVAAVFLPPLPGECIMIGAAAASFLTTGRAVHSVNEFSFRPIIEIAVLFVGIFATMMPAVDILRANAGQLVGPRLSPTLVYWSSGTLSAFLDSAPAYLAFFTAMSGYAIHGRILAALSVATVLFGAMTYVGNGPNLMVKAIADHQKFPAPSFAAYLFKWAAPIMLPLLIILWIVFFR